MSKTKVKETESARDARTPATTSWVGVRSCLRPRFLKSFLQGLNCPRSLSVWLLFKYKEHDQLAQLECPPHLFNNVDDFRDAYVATSILSKDPLLETTWDRKQVAFQKLMEGEQGCARTNARFRHIASDPDYPGRTATILEIASRKIAFVLGEFSPEEWSDECRWGPGSTSHVKDDVSTEEKCLSSTGITRDLLDLADRYLRSLPLLVGRNDTRPFEIVVGNKVSFVPKNAKTDRSIAIEPCWNIFFQRGIGRMISQRLRTKAGINLHSQARNQRLAKEASRSGELATIDFSNASNSIAKGLVSFLLEHWRIDPRWYGAMNTCRSHYGFGDKMEMRLWEMFSSMGNGFTFELETLIFWSLAVACCEASGIPATDVSVFGDDVILPASVEPLYRAICAFCGFTVNSTKTFCTGYFRESCGVHYWNGVNCQPYYLRNPLRTHLDVYKTANAVRYLAYRYHGEYYCCDIRFAESHRCLVTAVSNRFRVGIPAGIGDVGFVVDFDDPLANPRPLKDGHSGWSIRVHGLSAVTIVDSKRVSPVHVGLLYARLLWLPTEQGQSEDNPPGWGDEDSSIIRSSGGRTSELGNNYSLRGRTVFVERRMPVSSWSNLGPWA